MYINNVAIGFDLHIFLNGQWNFTCLLNFITHSFSVKISASNIFVDWLEFCSIIRGDKIENSFIERQITEMLRFPVDLRASWLSIGIN